MQKTEAELENKKLVNAYRTLLRACNDNITRSDKLKIRKAFNFAMEAHKGVRRKSGELYIFHPLAVATIVAREMGLGTTSIICALLHDVVEDTEFTLEDIEGVFGKKEAEIIDGLTKISGVVGKTNSMQAENFRKILLTLADDVRVILVKLADRLHNMRTLESVPRNTQLKISSETMILFAPMSHRLGLYAIKSELEDLCLKFTEPIVYREIANKLKSTKTQRNRLIRNFMSPIQKSLKQSGFNFEIKGRPKSIYSIYQKMKNQDIPFEKIYDIFAIRIILDTELEKEKEYCWRTYSIVTDHYKPNPNRLRDWISTPKANGYESLHTTVMGPKGNWVEVQIRSRRMDNIAEKGFASHWKYKEGAKANYEKGIEEWLTSVRELLENPESNAIEFLDAFKLNLFADEVFVFSPQGDLFKLPSNATALDFAFEIHTDLGLHCLGAKVNHRLVPLSHRLKNGDQVEILSSKKQKPSEDWLYYVVTAKARSKIKSALKEEKREIAQLGKESLMRKFRRANLTFSNKKLSDLADYFNFKSSLELFLEVGEDKIPKEELNKAIRIFESADKTKPISKKEKSIDSPDVNKKPDQVIVGEDADFDYSLARCCNPIPGDDIFGFVTIGDGIKIHRTNCPNGIQLMSKYGYRIIKARWANPEFHSKKPFAVGIKITGIDSVGIVSSITDIISKELKVNMESITIGSKAGAFEGNIILFIYDTEHLESLIRKIKKVQGIESVSRFQVEESLNPDSSQ